MNILNYFLGVFLLLALCYVFMGYSEGFSTNFGVFPCDVNHPILFGDYPVKKHVNLTNTYKENAKQDPYTEMSSYEQNTNHVRYWSTPNNGSCSPAEFCDSLYDKKLLNLQRIAPPNDTSGIRVNYYINQ